mgnify:CR=1 FL=1
MVILIDLRQFRLQMNEETAVDTTVVDPDVTKFTGELLTPRTTPRVAEDDREERIAAEVSAFFKDLDNDFTSRSENRSYNIISSHSKSKVPVLNMEDDSFRYTATGMLVQKSMEIPIIVQWPDSTFEYTFSSEPSNIKFGISFIAAVEEEDDIDDVDIEVIEEMTVLKASNETLLKEFSGLTGDQVNLLTELKRFGVGAYGYGEIDIIVEVQSENTISMTQNVSVQRIYQPVSWVAGTTQWTANYTAVNSDTQNTFYTALRPSVPFERDYGGLINLRLNNHFPLNLFHKEKYIKKATL